MVQPFWRKFALFFITSGAGMACFVASPFVIAKLIDHLVLSHSADQTTWLLVGAFVVLRILDEWLWRIAEFLVMRFLPDLQESVRTRLFKNTLQKKHRFFVDTSSGQIGYWINNGTDMVRDITESFIWTIWNQSFSFAVTFTFLMVASWKLAIVFAVWIVILVAVLIYRGHRQAIMVESQSQINSEVTGRVVDAASNNLPVRVFDAQTKEVEDLAPHQQRLIKAYKQNWWYGIKTNSFKGNSATIASSVAITLVVYLYTKGEVSLGSIALFVTYITSASENIWTLSAAMNQFVRNYGSLKNTINNLVKGTPERTGGITLKVNSLEVAFHGLRFAYPDQPEKEVLRGVDFEVKTGERVGVVGHSGAGKSTIVGLLLGLHQPTGGELLFNGKDISKVSLASIRKNCAFVPQDTSLFNRTIRENITYGISRKVSNAEIKKAAERAQALSFIEALPNGFDSLVGERGVKLSGGQRQRIAITRAMLSQAPLVILDEATSALDSVSEQNIQRALNEVMKNRTAIVIAHRLSTLKHLDRIIVLDNGKVAETGSHDELVAQNGIYADLWRRQKNGFLAE